MNQTTLQNWRSYHVPSRSHVTTRPRNAVFISKANSIKHELSKCVGALQVQRFGEVRFDEDLNILINKLVARMKALCYVEESCDFITEAVPNERSNRRVDLVNLNNRQEIEFETDHKVCKEGAQTILI